MAKVEDVFLWYLVGDDWPPGIWLQDRKIVGSDELARPSPPLIDPPLRTVNPAGSPSPDPRANLLTISAATDPEDHAVHLALGRPDDSTQAV